jgi:hypothetical protein
MFLLAEKTPSPPIGTPATAAATADGLPPEAFAAALLQQTMQHAKLDMGGCVQIPLAGSVCDLMTEMCILGGGGVAQCAEATMAQCPAPLQQMQVDAKFCIHETHRLCEVVDQMCSAAASDDSASAGCLAASALQQLCAQPR